MENKSVMQAKLHFPEVQGNPFYGNYKKTQCLSLEFDYEKFDYPTAHCGIQFAQKLRNGNVLECMIPKHHLEQMQQFDGNVYRCSFEISNLIVVVDVDYDGAKAERVVIEVYDNEEDFDEGHPTEHFILTGGQGYVPYYEEGEMPARHYYAIAICVNDKEQRECTWFIEIGKATEEQASKCVSKHCEEFERMGYRTEETELRSADTDLSMVEQIRAEMYDRAYNLSTTIRLVKTDAEGTIRLVSGFLCIEKEQEVVVQTYAITDDDVLEGLYEEMFAQIGYDGITAVYLLKGEPNSLPKDKLDQQIKVWQSQGRKIIFATEEVEEDEE